MDKIKKIGCVLVSLFLLSCIPVFAEDEATQEHEVFINSNALNSKISIETEGTTVSGPGNKVYTNVPADSTFDVVIDPAEGSELMALTLKQSTEDGTIETVQPIDQQDNVYTFQASGQIAGEAYFGDPVEESVDAAKVVAETAASDKIISEKSAKAQVTETPAEVEQKEMDNRVKVPKVTIADLATPTDTDKTSEPVLTADNTAVQTNLPVAGISETPDTGIEDIDFVPLLLFMIMLSSVILTVRKKEFD